jgi:hypothetical protein
MTKLADDGKAVLTNNGKPQALIFKIDGNSFEKTLSMLQKLEFMQNLTEMRLASAKKNGAKITLNEINTEIAATRRNKKAKK